jgi:hypothetical protein
MSTVNPIPISPLRPSYDTSDPYYLPPSSSRIQDLPESEYSDDIELEPRRGRDPSPRALPNLHSPSVSPARNSNPLEFTRRKSATTNNSTIIQAHHTLPSTSSSEIIPSDPVLYLPPLLSPLPTSIRHNAPLSIKGKTPAELEFATRLPDIDPASLSLHQTLHHFHPVNSNYSTTAYDSAFNWSEITLPEEVEREWYCVVFRSRRNKESSSLSLYQADREAHEEAVKNGGLVMYWYGVPNETTGSNLATCIWQS